MNNFICKVSLFINMKIAINVLMVQFVQQQIYLLRILMAQNQNCYFHSYFLSTFSNINFRSQFGANADPLRITLLFMY